MHEFSLFGFVVREGNSLAEELFFLKRMLDGHMGQIFFFFFERKIKLANEFQHFYRQ